MSVSALVSLCHVGCGRIDRSLTIRSNVAELRPYRRARKSQIFQMHKYVSLFRCSEVLHAPSYLFSAGLGSRHLTYPTFPPTGAVRLKYTVIRCIHSTHIIIHPNGFTTSRLSAGPLWFTCFRVVRWFVRYRTVPTSERKAVRA